MSTSYYDTAQICLNGHVINDMMQSYPEHNRDYCEQCGERTITACPECHSRIRGGREVPTAVPTVVSSPPSFCPDCGKPYPWTRAKLAAAKELAQELEGLDDEEKKALSKDLDDIVSETPRTPVAAVRLKKIIARAGKGTAEAIRDMVVDIASEAAKKQLWG